jgi:hypothetical protein
MTKMAAMDCFTVMVIQFGTASLAPPSEAILKIFVKSLLIRNAENINRRKENSQVAKTKEVQGVSDPAGVGLLAGVQGNKRDCGPHPY